jgi:hypothetical protein
MKSIMNKLSNKSKYLFWIILAVAPFSSRMLYYRGLNEGESLIEGKKVEIALKIIHISKLLDSPSFLDKDHVKLDQLARELCYHRGLEHSSMFMESILLKARAGFYDRKLER